MPRLRDDEVIRIFLELPGRRGCTDEELDVAERRSGVPLPSIYREMMRSDAARLVSAGIAVPLDRLQAARDDATEILIQDDRPFRLSPNEVVFAWDDIFAFHFFDATSGPDPPVRRFNYYSSDDGWAPILVYESLSRYFAEGLRRYLGLG